MSKNWKRWLAGLMTAVMLMGTLPTAAYAALLDNTPDRNEEILRELTEFWGDEKTAQEAMDLLRQYGLVDEEGNVLTDWSGEITIQEESSPLTVSEAREMSGGDVTVNGHPCGAAELKTVLDQMEALGLLVDGAPVANWQLQVNGEVVSPAELEDVLTVQTEPAPEPELEGEAAPVVTLLGAQADSDALLGVIAFLGQYGLLTDTGCAADWGLTLPGGERRTDLTELLAMLEEGDYDPDMVLTVDGTPVTMADFATMMAIQEEVQRIRDTYLQEETELTLEQARSLYDLYQQLQATGIQLYNTQGADELTFPSGADQTQRVTVTDTITMENGGSADLIVSLAHPVPAGEEVILNWRIAEGSATGTIDETTNGTMTFVEGESSKTLTVASDSDERWNGNRAFVVEFDIIYGALFDNGAQADSTTVWVEKSYQYRETSSNYQKDAFPFVPGEETDYKEGELLDAIKGLDGNPVQVSGVAGSQIQFEDNATDGTTVKTNIYWNWRNSFFVADSLEETARIQPGTAIGTVINCGLQIQYPEEFLPLIQDGIYTGINSDVQMFLSTNNGQLLHEISINDGVILDSLLGSATEQGSTFMPIKDVAPIDREKDYFTYNHSVELKELGESGSGVFWEFALEALYFVDTKPPEVEHITAPAGPYYYGQAIPVTVEFSEPVYGSGLQMTVNGQTIPAVDTDDGSFGYRQTFLYEVPENGDTQLRVSSITGMKDLAGKESSYTPADGNEQVLAEGSIQIPSFLSAVDGTPGAEATDLTYTPAEGDQPEKTISTVTVTLDMPADENLRNLIGDSYALDNGFASAKLAASLDGGETLIPLFFDNGTNPTKMTATVEIDASELVGFTGDAKDFVMEFYTIDETTHQSTGLLFGRYAAFSVNKPMPLLGEYLHIEEPEGWQDTIYVNEPPEDAQRTLESRVDAPVGCTWTQTRWVSSDEKIATIDPVTGLIHPFAKGTVEFWLEAVNGGLEEYIGSEYQSDRISLTIQEGAEPYLRIPQSSSSIRSGDPFTLRWASNLVQKNAEFGNEATTTFIIKVYEGKETTGAPVQTRTVIYDPSAPDGTITMDDGTEIPMWTQDEDGVLTPNQSFVLIGLDSTDPQGYTITISAQAVDGVPEAQEEGYTAQASLTVVSQPVKVHLTRPDTLFRVNDGTLTISYTLTNYDSADVGGAGASFELMVTDNSTGATVFTADAPDGQGGGSFSVDLSVAQTEGFRTIYDVSLKAKNTAEPDWSRDSFTLYIYDKNALDILVQPMENGRVTVSEDGNTVTMSNEDWIAGLTQEEILALNRDIDLQTAISINYGEHAWGEASDRIRWVVENSETAAVNYPQGAYYENIEGLPYTSYAPLTEFLLSGKGNGTTGVEAIHDLAGDALSSSVEVTVETLKDKLYLFQFYPAAAGLTMTYTNGMGEEKTATGDAQGRFAIYEASGINSNVYVKGTIDGELYLGTVYQNRLVSQEKDAVSLELYPLNSLELRKVATLPIYLVDADGQPYRGKVTLRAGVYRNGTYCADAQYGETADSATIDGDTDHDITVTGGKMMLYYDVTQFDTDGGANPVTAADNIQFVLELRAGDGKTYYPVFFTAGGTTNEADAIRMAERVISLEEVPEGQVEKPFVAQQAVYFAGQESGSAVNVRNQTGKLGPSSEYPNMLLSTIVLWWGETQEEQGPGRRSIQYLDKTGITLQGQQVDHVSYPFCSMPVTHSTVPLDQAQMEHLGMEDLTTRSVSLSYVGESGVAVKQEAMRWQLINALSLAQAGDSNGLNAALDALWELMQAEGAVSDVGNDFLAVGLRLATSANISSDFLTLQLVPTQDPTVFRGLVYAGVAAGTGGVSGAGGQGNLIETMDVEAESAYDLNYTPGLEGVIGLIQSGGFAGYGQAVKDEYTKEKNARQQLLNRSGAQNSTQKKNGEAGVEATLSGYFETEVYYDYNAQEWKMQLVTGGFQASVGAGYDWSANFQVGPVPLFLDLGVGIGATVDFNAAVNTVEDLNDYLTQLSIQAYLSAFGGFGFDYAVVALKLGIFGELSLAAQMRWLNAARAEIGDQFGYNVGLEGEVGIKAEVTVLFISYSAVLWSEGFEANLGISGNWDEIEDYWREVGAGKSGAGGIIVPDGANLLAYDPTTGVALLSAQQETALVDRDYLSQYDRRYSAAGPGKSMSILSAIGNFLTGNEPANVVETIKDAYSYAAPVITDDGEWLFYLDDLEDSNDATVVRVSAARKNSSGGYDVSSAALLDNSGYGDSGLKAAGNESHPVVVWSRVMEKPAITEPGQSITPDVQSAMMNSSDILVAVRDGDSWKVTNLTAESGTSNGLADLSPVVAARGSNILVAWRQVASSDAVDLTNFDAKDYIYYRYSSDYGETWTEAQPVYNGTSGSVKGIEAAMLSDGTAAVAFTLQTGEHDVENGTYYQEIAYAIVGKPESGQEEIMPNGNEAEYQVLRYVQVTDDENLDENPQMATVELEGGPAFVLGWHSLSTDGSSDIRLAAINTAGNRITGFVDSLSSLIQNTGVAVSSNFQFVQNAERLDDLSILWSETAAAEGTEETGNGDKPSHDYLSALRFRVEDGKISVTSAQRLVEMGDYTSIDSFNAYVSGGELYAVLQGTFYDYSNPQTIQVGNSFIQVASDETGIYTAKGGYTDTLRVDSVIPDYPNIKLGMQVPVQVSVTNLGTQPMTEVTVTIGSSKTTFAAQQDAFVAIAPGETRILTVFYTIPAEGQLPNPAYTVAGKFQSGGSDEATGTLTLNIPDLGIADREILVGAENGERILQFTLYNNSDAKLAGSGRTVRFNFYSDPECTQPISNEYFQELDIFSNGDEALKTISGEELALIDEGYYTLQYRFDLQSYIQQKEGDTTPFADAEGEVRDGGITLYAKAWVETEDNGGEMLEFVSNNNTASITLESLLKQAEGEPTTVTSILQNSESGSQVTVTLQNNSIVQKTRGNVIVTLLDEAGDVLEQQQSYTGGTQGDNGLITLGPEQRVDLPPFQFTKTGTSVLVTYSDLILDADNANLTSLSFSNIPGISLESFVEQGNGTYTYAVSTDDLTSTTVVAVAESGLAKVKITDSQAEGINALSERVELVPGEVSTISVTVASRDGSAAKTYILTVQNNGDPVFNWPDDGGTAEGSYGTEVFYSEDESVTINLIATAQGEYTLSYQWYSCDMDGSNTVALEDQNVSTLTIQPGTDAGVYYYRCKVTRQMLDGTDKDYWSSVATVQIKPAEGNYVTLTGTIVTFDGEPHGLTEATAAKAGSTLYYSTDGGETWSTTAPTFTAVGVHTVCVYAQNNNFTKTETATADVVIRENSNIQFKLETQDVSEAFSGYPEAIRTKYEDAAGLEAALKAEVTALGVPEDNNRVYDVKLLFSLNGGATWTEVTAENFPVAGITVKLPYPEGASRYGYNFTLLHLITDPMKTGKAVGDIETMDITLEEDGIRFTADCLSPFALGWKRRSSAPSSLTNYSVAVPETDHGSVTVSTKLANCGDTVTITATPDEGYQVDEVSVTTSGGREITVQQKDSATYTFTMPYDAVSVRVTFKAEDRWTNPFADVAADAWYYDAVRYVNENGLMAGTGASTFAPDLTTTRGMLVTILYRLEGSPDMENENWGYPFEDVDANAWYATAVYWARTNGIVAGYSDELFGPDDVITREQMATILYRYAQYRGYDTTEKADLSQYTDAAQVGAYAVDAIRWANAEGLVNGTSTTTLSPKDSATRAQVAVILTRFCQNIAP